jgi:heme exporter protein C
MGFEGLTRVHKVAILVIFIDMLTVLYSIYFGSYPPMLPGGRDPTSYLIIYIHIPAAWIMYAAFTIGLVSSILYLVKGSEKYDLLALSSITIGVVYGVGAIVTGMAWANEVWGSPWSWDPRQTATLILLLAYVGYIALRQSIADVERARVFSSAYAIAAYTTLPISYLSAIVFKSLHEQLPRQPLGAEVYQLLTFRVGISSVVFAVILYLYYMRLRGER